MSTTKQISILLLATVFTLSSVGMLMVEVLCGMCTVERTVYNIEIKHHTHNTEKTNHCSSESNSCSVTTNDFCTTEKPCCHSGGEECQCAVANYITIVPFVPLQQPDVSFELEINAKPIQIITPTYCSKFAKHTNLHIHTDYPPPDIRSVNCCFLL